MTSVTARSLSLAYISKVFVHWTAWNWVQKFHFQRGGFRLKGPLNTPLEMVHSVAYSYSQHNHCCAAYLRWALLHRCRWMTAGTWACKDGRKSAAWKSIGLHWLVNGCNSHQGQVSIADQLAAAWLTIVSCCCCRLASLDVLSINTPDLPIQTPTNVTKRRLK